MFAGGGRWRPPRPALTPSLGACLPPPPRTRSHTHTPRPPRTPGPGPHPASPPPIPPPWVRFASERARAVRGVSDTGQRMLAAPPMGPSRRARPRPSTPCTPASLSGPWRSGCLCAARRNARAQSRPKARHSLAPSSPLGRSLSFFSPPLIPSLFFSHTRAGIPKFYRWLSERYPLVNQPVLGTHVPEVDNLYLVRAREKREGEQSGGVIFFFQTPPPSPPVFVALSLSPPPPPSPHPLLPLPLRT